MILVEIDLGISTADAEQVELQFRNSELLLSFVDWKKCRCEHSFRDVLAFRWGEFDEQNIRDDSIYEVVASPWLAQETKLQAVPLERYVHYKLCFNAVGVLDILTRRLGLE